MESCLWILLRLLHSSASSSYLLFTHSTAALHNPAVPLIRLVMGGTFNASMLRCGPEMMMLLFSAMHLHITKRSKQDRIPIDLVLHHKLVSRYCHVFTAVCLYPHALPYPLGKRMLEFKTCILRSIHKEVEIVLIEPYST